MKKTPENTIAIYGHFGTKIVLQHRKCLSF